MGSGLHVRVPRASPCPWVAHPVSGRPPATCPPFRTRVRSGSGCPCLNLATDGHSSAHSTKGTPSPPPPPPCGGAGLRPAGSARVQALFHSPRRGAFHRSLTVLVHYRSPTVFSLGPWSTLLPAAFHVGGGTHDHRPPARTRRRLRDSHPLRSPVPAAFGWRLLARARGRLPPPPVSSYPRPAPPTGLPADPVWAPPVSLAATPGILSSPRGTEMFQFPRCPPSTLHVPR